MAWIYKIINKNNGKIYVGYTTKTPQERFEQHWNARYSDNAPIHKAMIKEGKNAFTVIGIEQIESSKWCEKEQYWIDTLKSYKPFGYNVCKGGEHKPPTYYGSENNKSKLSQEQFNELINDLKSYELEFGQIARKYKLSQCEVERINAGTQRHNDEFEYPIRKEKRDYYIIRQIINDLKENILSQTEIEEKYNIKSRTRLYNINTGKVGKKIAPQDKYPIREGIISRKPLYLTKNL